MATSTNPTGILWVENDVWGNPVDLSQEDWAHACLHPEMVGQEDAVRETIKKPDHVREGRYHDSAAHTGSISSTNPEGIRVMVRYERENFLDGKTAGHVTTAIPINTSKYPSPRLRGILWQPTESEGNK